MAMASASTSAAVNTPSPTNSVYDVFLSHRGPDTKNSFTSHLYHRLVLHGFRVFWDKEEMQVGETLTSQIREAIESASVQVAILSKGYADSEWCLEELHLMVESKKPIVPVFFDVQPTAVRQTHGKGVYAQALGRMKNKKTYGSQRRYSSTTIKKWSKALSTVGNISGLELDKFNNGDQGELLEKVVASVGKHLGKPGLDVAKHPTGLDEKIKDFKKKVQRQQSVKAQVIGIEGSGGIGKTTLAKQFFILHSSQYHKSCFLFDIREKALKDSLESLQKKLLRALTQKDENIESVDEGIKLLETRLSNCEALVILDDVDHINQLNALLTPIRDVLHPHSLILITSRDRDVLTRSRVEEPSIYKMTDLDPQQSRELFCMHAFTQPHPLPGFEALVDKYLKACNGLPLSLKLFGGLLYGHDHDKSFWEQHLTRLEQILPEEIEKSLRISYDALQRDEKQMFLDIACFFIGKSRDTVIRIWDGCGWSGSLGLLSLQNKNLVEVYTWVSDDGDIKENMIRMHDHLRDLGRFLAKDPGLPRRIWCTEDFDNLLQQSSITEVRGISTRWTKYEGRSFSGCKMKNLQLLDIECKFLKNDPLETILKAAQSPNLIWLCWRNCFCASLPSWIPMEKSRVLEVEGLDLRTLWQKESEAPLQLRELTIQFNAINVLMYRHGFFEEPSHQECSSFFQKLRCWNSSEVEPDQSLPDSFGKLTNLQCIRLTNGRDLQTLPDSFGNLTRLQYLKLENCDSIEVLPSQLAHLLSLEELYLRHLKRLKELPSDIGKLGNLKILILEDCLGLNFLPDSLGRLNQLTDLHIRRVPLRQLSFKKVEEEGKSICPNLKNLCFLECADLVEVGALPDALTTLEMVRCYKLRKIEWSSPLSKLQTLNLYDCFKVKQLPSLETLVSLEQLYLYNIGCVELSSKSGLDHLTKLRELSVSGCSKLAKLEGVERLTSLERLDASGCIELKSILGLAHLTKLRELSVSRCSKLSKLKGVERLTSLEKLNVSECVKLRSILGLAHLTKLQEVSVSRCSKLAKLEGVKRLTSLENLNVSECVKLRSISGLDHLTNLRKLRVFECSLKKLDVSGCVKLSSISGLDHLTNLRKLSVHECSLEKLDVSGCVKLSSISGLADLTKLRELSVPKCSKLVKLEGVEHLTSLEILDASGCIKLGSISGLAHLTKLRELSVRKCSKLVKLEGVEHLTSLEILDASGCVKLRKISGFVNLTKLRTVDFSNCSELKELVGIEHLISLEKLDTSGCPKLQLAQPL